MRVVCVNTGFANIASVRNTFVRLHRPLCDAEHASDIAGADALVLPGVGAFGPAMQSLEQRGLIAPLRRAIESGTPLLAVCLGLQLLCEGSQESAGVAGLGLVRGTVRQLHAHVTARIRVPHMGWNRITPSDGAFMLAADAMYFAHSFALPVPPPGWASATATHGATFVAALERDGVLACQFHPELSGEAGIALIRRWIAIAEGRSSRGGR
jgi:imidazole glycerol phosphate synthase glutamine amidotransferase subunit